MKYAIIFILAFYSCFACYVLGEGKGWEKGYARGVKVGTTNSELNGICDQMNKTYDKFIKKQKLILKKLKVCEKAISN